MKGSNGGKSGGNVLGIMNDDGWQPQSLPIRRPVDADGLETVAAWECAPGCPVRLLDAQSGERGGHGEHRLTTETEGRADEAQYRITPGTVRNHGDAGGASRFFYTAKASRVEREAGLSGGERKAKNWSSGDQNPGSFQAEGTDRTSTNHHPTVKPLDLMRWLCRLVTPPGGLILDPFAGSGTTGCAAVLEGFRFVGIEREPEFVEIARRRIAYWESLHQPTLDLGGVA